MDNPKLYSKMNVLQTRDALAFLEKVLENTEWGPEDLVLDVGCGPGSVTTILSTFLPPSTRIVGTDISKEMINYATSNCSTKRTIFKLMNIEDEYLWNDWKEGSFDKIFSSYCLHWISNQRKAARNMYSLLKQNGEIFLLFLSPNPIDCILIDLKKDPQWEKYINKGPYRLVEFNNTPGTWEDEYCNILCDAGFQDIKVKIVQKIFWYQSLKYFLSTLEVVDPIIRFIPEAEKEKYIQAFMDITLKNNHVVINPKNGKVYLKYCVAEVYAKKQ